MCLLNAGAEAAAKKWRGLINIHKSWLYARSEFSNVLINMPVPRELSFAAAPSIRAHTHPYRTGSQYFHVVWCSLTWCVWVEHALRMRGTCTTIEPYTEKCAWSIEIACGLMVRPQCTGLRLGLGSGNWFYMFLLFFFYFKKCRTLYAAMPLALSRDPGPTPSVGHMTGDMKRRESNETHTVPYQRRLEASN